MPDPLTLAERHASVLQVAAYTGSHARTLAALRRRFGDAVPDAPGTVVRSAEAEIVCSGPGRWLEIGATSPAGIMDAVEAGDAAVTDLSAGRVILALRGDGLRRLLAKGCSLDLDAEAFPANAAAASLLAGIGVLILAHADAGGFDIHVPRSYARSVAEWIADAAIELGGLQDLRHPAPSSPFTSEPVPCATNTTS